MAKNRVINDIKGIPPVTIDESQSNRPTRPPLFPHQKPAEKNTMAHRLLIKKLPLEEEPERRVPSSFTPQAAEEARATHDRLRQRLDNWENKETPDAKEFFFTGRSKLNQIRLAINLQGKTKLSIQVMES